jgi:hypothetical protein
MYLKIHQAAGAGDVVAVCDRELLNATLQRGEIKVVVSEGFYGRNDATPEEVREALRSAANANLMGERSVSAAIELGLVRREDCMEIGGVPHALIIRF